MDIPEEEIEQAIVWDLSLLKLRPDGRLKIVERQKALSTKDGFIDLLLEDGKKYYIIELKRGYIKNKSVVLDQVLRYRNSLMKEFELPVQNFVCMLANPQGFSDEVKQVCKFNHVIPRVLDEDKILEVLANRTAIHLGKEKLDAVAKIIAYRRHSLMHLNNKDENYSVANWVNLRLHDELAEKRMGQILQRVSKNAPIQAHQISNSSKYDYSLNSFEKCWFWLFYTVLDKRVHSSLFIRAREILEENKVFFPQEIIKTIENYGEQYVLEKITLLLEQNNFPLVRDFTLGKFGPATAIIEAAKLISKHDYNFDKYYEYQLKDNNHDKELAKKEILKDLSAIHGVGPRMTAQFVRGMVLKGNWKFELNDDIFLEKGRFNEYFAGPARFCLIDKGNEYSEKLKRFTDRYMNGDKGTLSHALWVIRKKYCGKVKHCTVCPMAGYCSYYLKANTVKIYIEGQQSILSWMPDPIDDEMNLVNDNS